MLAPTCKICGKRHWGLCPEIVPVKAENEIMPEHLADRVRKVRNSVRKPKTSQAKEAAPLSDKAGDDRKPLPVATLLDADQERPDIPSKARVAKVVRVPKERKKPGPPASDKRLPSTDRVKVWRKRHPEKHSQNVMAYREAAKAKLIEDIKNASRRKAEAQKAQRADGESGQESHTQDGGGTAGKAGAQSTGVSVGASGRRVEEDSSGA